MVHVGGNPGPCGAGACLFLPNEEGIDLKQPVSKRSSILLGELMTIVVCVVIVVVVVVVVYLPPNPTHLL